MFTVEDRSRLRERLIEFARAHSCVTGIAITGSGSIDKLDRWSDIDLAFGVDGSVDSVLAEFSEFMRREETVLDTLDVHSGNWIYRVFFLQNSLQVDLAFVARHEFGAIGSTFKLIDGELVAPLPGREPDPHNLIGWAWLYALHVRSSIERGKVWQAEFMIAELRNQVISLACLRHGLAAREGRGVDQLPDDFKDLLAASLPKDLAIDSLRSAFYASILLLRVEIVAVDSSLAERLHDTLQDMAFPSDP